MSNQNYPAGKYISMLYRSSRFFFNHNLDTIDISGGQFSFLVHLLIFGDGLNQVDLSKALKMNKGTTTRALMKLEEQDYITRQPDPDDRRSNIIFLTPKAHAMRPEILMLLKQWSSLLLNDFSQEERSQCINFLQRMVENVTKYRQSIENKPQ